MNKYFDIRPPQKPAKKAKKSKKVLYSSRSSNKSGTVLLIFIILLTFVLYFSLSNSGINYQNNENEKPNEIKNIGNLINKQDELQNNSQDNTGQSDTVQSAQPEDNNETKNNAAQKQIEIIVLNGASVNGLAHETKNILEENNISVSEIGNTQYPYQDTIIYYTNINLEYANNLRGILIKYNPTLKEDDTLASDQKIIIVVTDENTN